MATNIISKINIPSNVEYTIKDNSGDKSTHQHDGSDIVSGTVSTSYLPAMTGASSSAAGSAGIVPAPAAGDDTKYLRGDGTWQTVGGGGGTTIGFIEVTASIATSAWSSTTWPSDITTLGYESSGVCYIATLTVNGATTSNVFVENAISGAHYPIYAIPGSNSLVLYIAQLPTSTILLRGVILEDSPDAEGVNF